MTLPRTEVNKRGGHNLGGGVVVCIFVFSF